MREIRVLVVCLVSGLPVGAASASSRCPAPTVARGEECVLAGDAVLTRTLRLLPQTTLDCQGHRLRPERGGVNDEPRTKLVNEFQPSSPALAILVHRAHGVTIRNCVLEGFDFGVLVIDAKTPPGLAGAAIARRRNQILDNTIDVRTNTVTLTRADDTLIAGNQLTYAAERGRGVVVEFDSDDNQIVGNTITSTDAASTGLVQQVPGGPFAASQTAIMDNEIHCLMGDRPLRDVVIDGELIQVQAADDTRDPNPDPASIEDSARPDHNLIEGNFIFDLGHGTSCTYDPDIACRVNQDCPAGKGPCLLKQNSGIGFNIRAGDTVVRGNYLSGRMERGVSFGGVASTFTIANWYPGTCSDSPDPDQPRLCVDDSDCALAGLPDAGTCAGTAPITFDGNTVRLVAQGNTLVGRYDTAALFANNTDGFVQRGNRVIGGAEIVAGIQVGRNGIHGTVERNAVDGTRDALALDRPQAITFTIRLNDFSGYATAIRTSDDFTVPTTLGGNYWGRACPGLDPAEVRSVNGSVNHNVTDVSYGVPVAATPDDALPSPCP